MTMKTLNSLFIHLWKVNNEIYTYEDQAHHNLHSAVKSFIDVIDENIGQYYKTIICDHDSNSFDDINIADEALRYLCAQGYIKGDYIYDIISQYADNTLVDELNAIDVDIAYLVNWR